jgi:hypothetical protein
MKSKTFKECTAVLWTAVASASCTRTERGTRSEQPAGCQRYNAPRFLAFIFILFITSLTSAQESFIETAIADLPNKTAVSVEPQAVVQSEKTTFTTAQFVHFRQQLQANAENRVLRLLVDEASAVIFGYEMTVEPLGGNKFRITLSPLAKGFNPPRVAGQSSSLAGNRRRTTLLTLPQHFAAQTLQDGDALTVDLLEHPQLAIKITDKIRVSASRNRLLPAPNAPRDLTLNDLEMAVKNLKLKVNDGDFLPVGRIERSYAGSFIWLYLPPKGFFLLSLAPQEGYDFRKIGTISDKTIKFAHKGDLYEFASDEAVLPLAGAWNLWVLHEPNYHPFFAEMPKNPDYEPLDIAPPDETVENPLEINGTMSKPNEKSGFKPIGTEDTSQTSRVITVPQVRLGAVNRIENILPKD